MRILLVEDNVKTADYLQKGLQENLFAVDKAHDGQEGLFLANQSIYDAIILDVMLPYVDGWTIIQKIRSTNSLTPILFLTACDEVDNRVKGFELGADDYLIKPFAFSELLARLRSLLRRKQAHAPQVLEVADLKIDLLKHKASRGGQQLNLSAKEFSLLRLFAQREGEVLSRTYIAEQVWDINFDSDSNVIDVAVKRLREKIDRQHSVKLIHTMRGVGYVFETRE